MKCWVNPGRWNLTDIEFSFRSFIDIDDAVFPEVAVEDESGFVEAFGLSHVVEIMLGEVEDIGSPALYLELIEAHRHVLFPYFVRSDMTAQVFDLEQ